MLTVINWTIDKSGPAADPPVDLRRPDGFGWNSSHPGGVGLVFVFVGTPIFVTGKAPTWNDG